MGYCTEEKQMAGKMEQYENVTFSKNYDDTRCNQSFARVVGANCPFKKIQLYSALPVHAVWC